MKWTNKWIIGCCLLAITLTVLACSMVKSDVMAKDREAVSVGAPTVLSVFAAPPLDVEDLKTNTFTKYLEKKLNIRFEFDIANNVVRKERKQMSFASGDYPAVFLGGELTADEQVKYGMSGVLRPLGDLIDQYGNNIKQRLEEHPELRKAITAPDGKIYALPSVNECLHCWYAQKLWVNTEWLKKLNLSPPATTEQFYEMLKAFKTKDPNGNGIADEIPLTGASDSWHSKITGFLMSAFIYNTDDNYLYIVDGKVGLAAAQPEWKEGLKYIRKLYQEGLIDPSAFTQTIDGLVQLATQDGDIVLGSATLGHIRMAFGSLDNERNKQYDTIAPLIGPSGYQAAGYFKTIDTGQFAITDKATEAQAVAAIQLADYLYSEEAVILNEFGPEGLWWRRGLPGEVDEHGRPAKYKINPEYFTRTMQNEGWSQMGISYRDRELRESWAVPEDPYSEEGYEHRLYTETMKNYAGKEPKEVYPANLYVDPDIAFEAARLRVQINEYVESNMVQFITGTKNIEEEWDAYLDGFSGLKLERYLGFYQKAYDSYRSQQ
ncbi:ABC transporter substrate-binding protein [Paenibacillus solisilvae]|uniref:ABC transporter substrate-binding protein n=1 Tax=Paenibacillus solisilvae TaxID=2486751 RepID=A0ABW0W1X6_9BACL